VLCLGLNFKLVEGSLELPGPLQLVEIFLLNLRCLDESKVLVVLLHLVESLQKMAAFLVFLILGGPLEDRLRLSGLSGLERRSILRTLQLYINNF